MEKENVIKSKTKIKKYRIIIILLNIILGLYFVAILILTPMIFKNETLELSEKISIIPYDNQNNDDEYANTFYGIQVVVILNYELKNGDLNPIYSELFEKFGFKNNLSYNEKIQSDFFKVMNECFYEKIKNNYNKFEFETTDYSAYLRFYYYWVEFHGNDDPQIETIKEAKKKMKKQKNIFFKSDYYKELLELSHEEYIESIRINMYIPSRYEADEVPPMW